MAQRNSSVVNSLVSTLPNWSWEKARPFPAPFQRETLPISKKKSGCVHGVLGRQVEGNKKIKKATHRTAERIHVPVQQQQLVCPVSMNLILFIFPFFFYLFFVVVPLYTCFKCHLLFSRSAPFPLSNNNNNEIYEKKSDVWPSCWWNRFLKK